MKKLYRYRSANTAYFEEEVRRLLQAGELYLPSRRQLNDPFDCQPIVEAGVTIREFRVKIVPIINHIQRNKTQDFVSSGRLSNETRKNFMRIMKKLPYQYYENLYRRGFFEYIENYLLDEIGVLSLSSALDSELLWSHYSDSHRGVSIELSISPVTEAENGPTSLGACNFPCEVTYSDVPPQFDFPAFAALLASSNPATIGNLPQHLKKYVLAHSRKMAFWEHKRTAWQYEKESRCIAFHGGGKYHRISSGEPTAIYLGAKIGEDAKRIILDTAARMKSAIRIYQSHLDRATQSVRFGPM